MHDSTETNINTVMQSCSHVVCKTCTDTLVRPSSQCVVCDADASKNKIVELRREGQCTIYVLSARLCWSQSRDGFCWWRLGGKFKDRNRVPGMIPAFSLYLTSIYGQFPVEYNPTQLYHCFHVFEGDAFALKKHWICGVQEMQGGIPYSARVSLILSHEGRTHDSCFCLLLVCSIFISLLVQSNLW